MCALLDDVLKITDKDTYIFFHMTLVMNYFFQIYMTYSYNEQHNFGFIFVTQQGNIILADRRCCYLCNGIL